MINTDFTAIRIKSFTWVGRLAGAILLSVWLFANSQAQTTNTADGVTPLGITPGAPAGSYALSGFDNVNLYNGNLNFRLPLAHINGRGGAGYTMMLPIERRWTVTQDTIPEMGVFNYPEDTWWSDDIKPGYGPGVMHSRLGGSGAIGRLICRTPSGQIEYYNRQTVTRLTFTAADGTEFNLIDQLTQGLPAVHSSCPPHIVSRGTVFVSTDGTSATFISDTTIYDGVGYGSGGANSSIYGYLMLRDGTRFRINNGVVAWMRDRNGNLLTFTYDSSRRVTSIIDSLNRQVTIVYDVNDGAPYGVCDRITVKGFGGATRIIRVSKTNLGSALRSGYSLQTPAELFPPLNGSSFGPHDPPVVSAVWMPDSDGVTRKYQFFYNSYAELARVALPTGGAFEYDWAPGLNGGAYGGAISYSQTVYHIYRRVIEKRIYPDGVTLAQKTTFSRPEPDPVTTLGYVVVDQLDAGGALLARQHHYFHGAGSAASLNLGPLSSGSTSWDAGREYQTDEFAANGVTLLRRVVQTWEDSTTFGQGPHIIQTTTTLADTNQVAKHTFSYDSYNNQTDIREYDFGSGAPPAYPTRHTHTDYLTSGYDTNTNIHLRNLPSQQLVYAVNPSTGAETQASHITYEYDLYDGSANHSLLVDRPGVSGLDSGFTTGYTTRGNATKVSRWLDTTGGWVHTYAQYDIAGNVVKAIDARGNSTTFGYADCFGAPDGNAQTNTAPSELSTPGLSSFAMLTSVTNALSQTVYAQYDYYLGRTVDGKDINGVVASGYFDDVLDRPTKVIHDYNNLAAKSKIEFSYDDTNHIVTTKSDFASYDDKLLRKEAFYDGLGRTTETRVYETSTAYVTTKQIYDALGRISQVSNPYRSGETVYWTTTTHDALSRVTSVTTPGSAVASTSYSGNTVTATDPAGKSRKSVTDALGRLITVYEDPSGLNYQTTYSYDVLDDLTQVSQGSQTRTFAFDSLKRLTSATNPENGTITIDAFDNNGNVLVSTDARGVSTHVAYDELNRPTRRWYNSSNSTSSTINNSPPLPSGVAATNEVAYFYDAQTLPNGAPSFTRGYSTGRAVAVTYGGGSAGTYAGFDALGRTLRKIQQTDSVDYLVEASYNVSGVMTSETYPSVPGASGRRVVNYSFDTAGRLSSLSSSATSYAPAASVSSITYASHGALSSGTYGNGLIQATTYNTRLQVSEIKLGTSGNSTSVLDLTYNRGTTTNNGNIQSVSYSGGGLSYTQSFSYDALNRLSSATETIGSTTNWSQTNAYDRYGNRQIDYGGGSYNVSFSSSTNRITTSGFSYDSSGNLTNDGAHSYGFDAEDKILAVDSTTAYTYNGSGQRVRKLAGENTRFVYGIAGELIMEFDGSSGNLKKEYVSNGITIEPTAVNSNGTQYSTADHLGTPRVYTNSSGSVVSRHDYMPFGGEIGAGTGGRTTGMGYSSTGENNRKKFGSYERDGETGLDFVQARYFASLQGRFTSPDSVSGIPPNPQTLNLYAYVQNNPLAFADPTGHFPEYGGADPCTSTHVDTFGNVLAVYNDGDFGIYKHADLSKWDGKSILPKTGKGVTKVGETLYWDEFAYLDKNGNPVEGVQSDKKKRGRIIFDESWDPIIAQIHELQMGMASRPDLVAEQSRNFRSLDIKTRTDLAPYGDFTGRKADFFFGRSVYMSAKSIGNFMVGYFGASIGSPLDFVMNLAGALQQKQWEGKTTVLKITKGKTYGQAPYYGETEYAGRMIVRGYEYGSMQRGGVIK